MLDLVEAATAGCTDAARAALLHQVAALAPNWYADAGRLDEAGLVPEAALQPLRQMGALLAPFPCHLGGLGMGTEPSGAPALLALLRQIGAANLALGRIFEGHVNAAKLLALYGTQAQLRRAADDAAGGHLFAVWATEGADPVRWSGIDGTLSGRKLFCSAAAQASRAVITATHDHPPAELLLVALSPGARADVGRVRTLGMRSCGTGSVDVTGITVPPDAVIGQPGDYLRQPGFSGGAWRASAVALGGLDALLVELRRQLLARDRQDDPHQQARLGEVLVAAETAALWADKAARLAEADGARANDADAVAAYVDLARCAIEAACLDAMRLVQRSLGLAALVQPNPVERLLRDLTTYLRQPAPDEALTEAAAWFTRHDLPAHPWAGVRGLAP